MTSYPIPASPCIFEETIKKSRFITIIEHTDGADAAKSLINSIRQQHAGARHHCWAFVAGPPQDQMQLGFSDDGEPSGTAGKPILAQLTGSGIGEVCAVVVRYSGGIKLGTGGLVKAYGGGVSAALKQLSTKLKVPSRIIEIRYPYRLQGEIAYLIKAEGLITLQQNFTDVVKETLRVPEVDLSRIIQLLRQLSEVQIITPQN